MPYKSVIRIQIGLNLFHLFEFSVIQRKIQSLGLYCGLTNDKSEPYLIYPQC